MLCSLSDFLADLSIPVPTQHSSGPQPIPTTVTLMSATAVALMLQPGFPGCVQIASLLVMGQDVGKSVAVVFLNATGKINYVHFLTGGLLLSQLADFKHLQR